MSALKAQTRHSLAHVEEVTHGKVIGLILQTAELAHLRKPLVHHHGIA